jgi:murein L,D-transpeptidase YafK
MIFALSNPEALLVAFPAPKFSGRTIKICAMLIVLLNVSASAQSLNDAEPVPANLLQIPISSNFYSPYAFVVDKSARILTVWQRSPTGLREVAQFPADFGKNSGEKTTQGDFKTPEGIYFLQEKREGASLDFNLYGQRAFTTDYPNFFDRMVGKTGGGIWLHAVPDTVPLTRGSRGCVVVRNEVILDLSQYVKLGRTPILIQDKAQMIPAKELQRSSAEVAQWLDSWRSSWETKNIDSYINHYSRDFRSLNMNRNQWRRYKSRLALAYKSIAVRLSKPLIFVDRSNAIVRFLQEYNSEKHADLGEKVLYLKRTADGYRIVGEAWSEESGDLARQEIDQSKSATSVSCATADGADCVKTSSITH